MSLDDTLRLIVREELRAALQGLQVAAPPAAASTNPEMLTIDEVAVECRVSPATARAWVRSGKLIGKKVGRGYLIERGSLNRFLSALQSVAEAGASSADSEVSRILSRARGGR